LEQLSAKVKKRALIFKKGYFELRRRKNVNQKNNCYSAKFATKYKPDFITNYPHLQHLQPSQGNQSTGVPTHYPTIQAAINAANDGDTVLVADGTYTGSGNRDIDFNGKAITVRSKNGPNNCIIDCNGTTANPHRGFYFHSGENTNSILDGFTVTGGYAYSDDIAFSGGMYNSGNATITNCVLYNDIASLDGNEIALQNFGSRADVNYSDVKGSQAAVYVGSHCTLNWGLGNINADPCFVSPLGNLCLQAGSPCIDAGDNNSVPPHYPDLDGHGRIGDGNGDGYCVVDMGAYEFPSDVYAPIGDFDSDCDVDFQDFAIFALAWLTEEGQTNYKPICDIGQPIDKKINMLDLEIFCEHWLEGTGP
jgi:hypothetical protein